MLNSISISTVWSTDIDRDLAFFTDQLGLEVRADVPMESVRFVTVGVPGKPHPELALMRTDGRNIDPESAAALTTLVTKGVLGGVVFETDDCHGDHRRFAERGVEFVQTPQERPYGLEAVFRDPSGNWYSLVQEQTEMDMSKPWDDSVYG